MDKPIVWKTLLGAAVEAVEREIEEVVATNVRGHPRRKFGNAQAQEHKQVKMILSLWCQLRSARSSK